MQHIFRLSPFVLYYPQATPPVLLLLLLLCFAYDFLYTNQGGEPQQCDARRRQRERERATRFLAGFLFIQINYDFYVCAKHVVSN